MDPSAVLSISQAGPYTLTGGIASDIDTTVLMNNSGPALRNLGVRIRGLNSFEVHKDHEVQSGPALVMQSCAWPPPDTWVYLGHLLEKYTNAETVTHMDKCRHYEAIIFEALVGQIPAGTVISIIAAMIM